MRLVGLDIGFSKHNRTNAIAYYRDGELECRRMSVDERNHAVTQLSEIDVIAIDAPILPTGASIEMSRVSERVFSKSLFQKRCKPGMSNVVGTGRTLREHGGASALLASRSLRDSATARDMPRVIPARDIVEAFPNAFLGVALHDAVYVDRPKLGRGKKFDWLYDRSLDADLFERVTDLTHLPANVTQACRMERDHEKRAALVCLLTAACVASQQFTAVGNTKCGYFFLPPRKLWATWASATLDEIAASDSNVQIVAF